MENIHKIHYIGHSQRDSKNVTELQCEPEQFKGRIIFMLIDNVGRTRKQRKMYYECCNSCELCSQILARTLVILGTWIREEMVRNMF